MPRYRNEFGVVVDIPQELAGRINGLTPVASAPSAPAGGAAAPKTAKRAKREDS